MLRVDRPNIETQKIFAWSGLVMVFLFILGFWVIAGYVPPSDPRDSVQDIVDFYDGNTTAIHLGLWLTMMAAALCATFFTEISIQMRRIEGQTSPLAFAQMVCGALFVIEFFIPLMLWQTADYRPTLDPEMTYRLHDMGWLFFLGVNSTGVLQAVLIGWIILRDDRERPIFPRWVGYTSLWVAFLSMPAGLVVFFKHGLFAWNGLLAWWVVLIAFGIWILTLVWALLARAIPDHEREIQEAAG